MPGTTYSGYHDPVGADPVEPATGTTLEKDAKPTDVALLARSIEQAHASGYAISGGSTSLASNDQEYLTLGSTVTNSVSGEFARQTVAGGGHCIEVASAGRYVVTGYLSGNGSAEIALDVEVRLSSSADMSSSSGVGGGFAQVVGGSTKGTFATGAFSVSAGQFVGVRAYRDPGQPAGTVSCAVAALVIQRVGP